MHLSRVVCVLAACSLAFAACGGDDDDDGGSAETAEPSADDQELADQVIALFEDTVEGDGFTETTDTEEDNEIEFASEECQQFAEALPGDDEDLPGETASTESGEFEHGDITAGELMESVQAQTGFVEEPSQLDVVFDAFRDDRFEDCIEEGFLASLEQSAEEDGTDLEPGDISVEATEGTGLGDESAGLEVEGSLSSQGFSFNYTLSMEAVRVGRSATLLMLVTIGDGEPTADLDALMGTMVDEIESADA